MTERKPLSWKPKRTGVFYCSPACGANCTRERYEQAVSAAKSAARKMGKGWRWGVHENMGWFATIASPCGRVRISVPLPGRHKRYYSAFFSDRTEKSVRPECCGRWVANGRTARSAMRHVLQLVTCEVAELVALTEGICDL